MSSEQRPAINLYGIFNEELNRMHDLLKFTLSNINTTPSDPNIFPQYHHKSKLDPYHIYNRIHELQEFLANAIKSHDPLIQEKIAELALTGDQNETIPTR